MANDRVQLPPVVKAWYSVCLALLLLVVWQCWIHANSTAPPATWTEAPSALVLLESESAGPRPDDPESTGIPARAEPGDLLLRIDRSAPESAAQANQGLRAAVASSRPTTVTLFRPSSLDRLSVPASGITLQVADLPPALLVRKVGSGPHLSALRPGDLIVAIGNEGLGGGVDLAGTSRLARWLSGWKPDSPMHAATSILARTPMEGGSLRYQLIRNGESLVAELAPEPEGYSNAIILLYAFLWFGTCFGLTLFAVPPGKSGGPVRLLGAFVVIANLYALWFAQRAIANPFWVDVRDAGLGMALLSAPALAGLGRRIRVDLDARRFVLAGLLACVIPAFVVAGSGFVDARYAGGALLVCLATLPWLAQLRQREHGHLGSLAFFVYAGATAGLAVVHLSVALAAMATPDPGYFSVAHIEEMLFGRGAIPPAILWVFLVGALYLAAALAADLRSALPGLAAQVIDHAAKDADVYGLRRVSSEYLERSANESNERLTPVSWAETSLPLLGFLGTIVGIAQAMARISQELLSGRASIAVLEQGFGDVALAFETTFLGLLGLLLLTAGEHGLRAHAARRLRSIESDLDRVVDSIATGSVVAQVTRKTRFDSFLLNRVALVAQHPVFDAIQAVLLAPTIEFEKDDGFRTRALKALEQAFGERPRFGLVAQRCVRLGGRSEGEDADTTVAVVGSEKQYAVRLLASGRGDPGTGPTPIEGVRPIRLLATARGQTILVRGAGSEWHQIALNDGTTQKLGFGVGSLRRLWVARSARADWVIAAVSDDESTRLMFDDLSVNRIGQHLALPSSARWNRWGFHQDSRELFASGPTIEVGASGTRFLRVAFDVIDESGPAPSLRPHVETNLLIDDEIDVSRLWPLPEKRLVIETAESELLVWELSRREPRRLRHSEWLECRVVASSGNWLAVIRRRSDSRRELQMWSIRGDQLVPYKGSGSSPTSFRLQGDIEPASWSVSGDGRRLLAVCNGELLSWRFPQYRIDEF